VIVVARPARASRAALQQRSMAPGVRSLPHRRRRVVKEANRAYNRSCRPANKPAPLRYEVDTRRRATYGKGVCSAERRCRREEVQAMARASSALRPVAAQ